MLHRYSVYDGRIAHSDAGTIPVDVYVMPDGEERAYLTDELGIDPHTLASSIDPDETPRIEFEDDYTAIILKYPKNYSADDNFLFRVKSMGIFLFADRVVLVIDEEFPQLFTGKFATKVYTRQDVLLRVLTQTIRHFESHLRVINMCSDEIETKLTESNDSSNLLDMFTLEKGLVYYVNALSGNRRAFERIRAGAYKFQFTEENIELLDDLQIENRQFLDQAQVYSQVLSGLMDARHQQQPERADEEHERHRDRGRHPDLLHRRLRHERIHRFLLRRPREILVHLVPDLLHPHDRHGVLRILADQEIRETLS